MVPPSSSSPTTGRASRRRAGTTCSSASPGSTTSRAGGHAGLGLAIVKDVVTDHGGTVAVDDDDVLGGARVVVTLPTG